MSGRQYLHVTKLGFHINPKENSFRKLVQKLKRDPTVWSKVMAILTNYSSLAGQTSTSPTSDYTETLIKTFLENSCKTLSAIQWLDQKLWPFWPVTQVWLTRPPRHRFAIPCQSQGKRPLKTRAKIRERSNDGIKRYGHFDPLLKSSRQDLLVTELRFHRNPNENILRKLVQNFERDPTVGSKVMDILTRYSSLADETSSSPSCDSISIPRKQPPKTRAKIQARSNGGIKTYGHFDPLLKSGRHDLHVTELGFHINPKENGFRKLGKTWSAIQWSDRKLWPFWPITKVWLARPPRHPVAIT
jgi:hypothetical protein